MFVYYLKQAAVEGKDFDDSAFAQDVFENVEQPFTFDKTMYPTMPIGELHACMLFVCLFIYFMHVCFILKLQF